MGHARSRPGCGGQAGSQLRTRRAPGWRSGPGRAPGPAAPVRLARPFGRRRVRPAGAPAAAALSPTAKGAWVALFGGPGYLLIATVAGWAVPGWGAFLAIAAFIVGFAVLVIQMGDRPPRDSGPDDGAVV